MTNSQTGNSDPFRGVPRCLYQLTEACASKVADLLHQLLDAAALLGGKVPCAAWPLRWPAAMWLAPHPYVDKSPYGMASAMELHRSSSAGAEQRTGNDPVELLARAMHIGCTCEHNWEPIGLMEAVQVQITGCAAYGIGGAGAKWLCSLIQPPSVLPYTSGVVTCTYFCRNRFCVGHHALHHWATTLVRYQWVGLSQLSATIPWAAKFTTSSGCTRSINSNSVFSWLLRSMV